MANINSTPRPAYVYDANTSTWFPVSGMADTNVSYSWAGQHVHNNSVTFAETVLAQKGINIFLNPSARDTEISSPIYGLVVFLKQNDAGNVINDLQYYSGSEWVSIVDPPFVFNQQSTSYTLTIGDANKIIEMSAGGTLTIPTDSSVNFQIGTAIDLLQTGVSQVTIAGAGGVTVNATPGLKLRTQWSSATLVKRSENTWLVMGDLVA